MYVGGLVRFLRAPCFKQGRSLAASDVLKGQVCVCVCVCVCAGSYTHLRARETVLDIVCLRLLDRKYD